MSVCGYASTICMGENVVCLHLKRVAVSENWSIANGSCSFLEVEAKVAIVFRNMSVHLFFNALESTSIRCIINNLFSMDKALESQDQARTVLPSSCGIVTECTSCGPLVCSLFYFLRRLHVRFQAAGAQRASGAITQRRFCECIKINVDKR